MKLRVIACALAGACLATTTWAKKPVHPEFRQMKKEMAQLKTTELAPAVTDTGDANSFGRNVKFIGLVSSGSITLASDCTPDPDFPPGPDDHCFVVNPAPAITNVTVTDAGRMMIPGKSSNSLFCHWQTPVVTYAFANPTGVYQPNARFTVTPSYKIENAVLNDPSLIDPATGLPFGGSFTTGLAGIRHSRSLQPDEFQVERDNNTRSCIAGMVSKRNLIEGFGLTEAQATNFFKNDTIITLNLQIQTRLVDFAGINYGTRFVGD